MDSRKIDFNNLDGPLRLYGMDGGAYREVRDFIEAMMSSGSSNPAYEEFRRRYEYDPVGFAENCIDWPAGERLTDYQVKILEALVDHQRVAVRGPHGIGKSTIASMVVLWFALSRDTDDWKCPTTASSWQQLTRFLWPEIRKWRLRLRWDVIGREPFDNRREALVRSLNLDTGQAFAIASNDPASMEGAHADNLAFVFDEAKNIPDATFDALEGAFSGAGSDTGRDAFALAISTPGEPVGRFYDIHQRAAGYDDWHVIHVSLEDGIASGRIDRQWAETRRTQWGESSALYQNRVLGEFCPDDEAGIIPIAWIEESNLRWLEWNQKKEKGEVTTIGVDIGRGGDKTIFALCYDKYAIDKLQSIENKTTTPIIGRAEALLGKNEHAVLIPDGIGMGATVADVIEDDGYNVLPFVASKSSDKKDRTNTFGFANLRAAAWWTLREMLDPEYKSIVALPPDDDLTGELTTVQWKEARGGKIQIESKADIRARLRRSTDHADAVIQALTGMELAKKTPKGSWA